MNERTAKMNEYEARQLKKLRKWQSQGPDWGTRLLAKPAGVAGKVVQKVIPISALKLALNSFNGLAERLSSETALLKRAGVSDLAGLRVQSLEKCDLLAKSETRRAMGMGGVGGAAFGVFGAAGLVADVPTLLTLAMRTVHRIGLCYGEDISREFAIGVFALASANTREEKTDAITALRNDVEGLGPSAARDGLERAAERQLAKDAAVFSLNTLSQRIGLQLGKRKAAGMVPVLGAVVGGAVNAWYLHDVAQVAQYVFQERWLLEKHADLPR
ncbi:EcsC family protein [Stenotrophobium rhamnosiphilum]|uniref:EcsC family protein n=1 Tax=Stenotrophobium rhamnosiphilum TaxID=2029166 RepID=A0A2T5MF50_9GAMM|nr:EcsC family protein [Stenotrophobium rhamnosiphilum]PTU31203.1 hypothetical protein CJD38_07575 [Stenotrophobium rhamnosiphilum]